MGTHTPVAVTELEEGVQLAIDFSKLQKVGQTGAAVVPVVVQDADSKEVLIVAYANEQALQRTLAHGIAIFWSTSRNELWIKGATSGDTLAVVEVRVNCEQNSLLYLVRPQGEGACHTKDAAGRSRPSCYYRRIRDGQLEMIYVVLRRETEFLIGCRRAERQLKKLGFSTTRHCSLGATQSQRQRRKGRKRRKGAI